MCVLCVCVYISHLWGAWMAQSVKRLTLAQVMISQIMGSSPASGSVLTAQSLDPALDSVSPSLSALPLLVLSLCLKHFEKFNLKNKQGHLGGSVG